MTNVIEIVVIGSTGSGKSHVLELIDKSLRAEYGHHVQIASHDLSCERGLCSPGEKPRVSDTIFSLRERGTHAAGGSSGSGKVDAGTSAIDAALDNYWQRQLASGAISYEQLAGDIAKLRSRVEQIHKRGEDTSALLYRWDRTGVPAAHVDCGISVVAQEVQPLAAVEGVEFNYASDPLQSAIESAVRMLNDDRDRFHELQDKGFESGKGLLERLATHLDALLALQLKSLAENQLPNRQE